VAKLIIHRFEERVLYPDLPVKHYKVYCALQDSKGVNHETYCMVSKEQGVSVFDFGCFEDADIDEFDYKNKWAMSEMVLKWAEKNIHVTFPPVEQDKKSE
jgi:hypothetical protein